MEDWHWVATGVTSITVLVYWLASRSAASAPKPKAAATTVPAPAKTTGPEPQKTTSAETASEGPKAKSSASPSRPELPKLAFEDDEDLDETQVGAQKSGFLSPPTAKIVYDEDAAIDEPTQASPLIMVTATGQTDKGLQRKRNEDSLLIKEAEGLFVVADGMGGYRGGELASHLAVKTIEEAFSTGRFEGPPHDSIPSRASELARAIQMANHAILTKALANKKLEGMGTTVCAARFSPNKQRLYVGHVGDSRIYCLREGKLRQMTSDHTMRDLGITGAGAAHLSRAVGIWPTVPIDIILGKPRAGDVYMLCSDGLTKMVPDAVIEEVLASASPKEAVDRLITAANDHGGKDNISVVIVRIDDPRRGVPTAA